MTALRTTRPTIPRSARVWAAGLCALGLFGCGTDAPPAAPAPPAAAGVPGTNDPAWLTSRSELPAPDLNLVDYDPSNRTLTFADPPGRDRWMVRLPDDRSARPAGPRHRLPEGTDTRRTEVFLARPGVKVSAPVTVAAIEACRRPHTSLAVNR
ncbi:MAG: hypothetical protein C0501_27955 [Isosphaera sp.]|nr:hypothetical protein [Isosphaera sp.]